MVKDIKFKDIKITIKSINKPQILIHLIHIRIKQF